MPAVYPRLATGFPPIQGLRWFNIFVLTFTPAVAAYGFFAATWNTRTVAFSCVYYVFSMLGITAGYHRLWAHRSYIAAWPLQLLLLAGGTSAVQGSCYWWARAHRAHHRHTDTDLDPYNSKRGLLWTHVGWMLVKSELRAGPADVADLRVDPLLKWQHRHYFVLAVLFGFALPAVVPAMFWGDGIGGLCFSAALRLTIAHQSTFCINSLAHWLGEASYDDVHSPRDHLLSAILTMGEGYHNFHHQFPMDYRNAVGWYQYDPTKWFIAACRRLGLARHLRVFPRNEIAKGALAMQLRTLKDAQNALEWPATRQELPVVSWDEFREQAKTRLLIVVSGFIHDASQFLEQHPGGSQQIEGNAGRDMTAAFFGGVYAHSNAAHNLLSMMRVGILSGGMEVGSRRRLVIVEREI